MATIRAEEVRIPRRVRDAVARHEEVVVMNRERPAFVIVHPDDRRDQRPPTRLGRPLRDGLAVLAETALPDPSFADDMVEILGLVGEVIEDPWAPS
jgi:hypothetical protein